jgi:spore maturation protein SpmA
MALSRIWSAFIIIAILVATIKFTFQPGQQKIFSQLVTGKNTDTVSTRLVDSASLPVNVIQQLQYEKTAVWDKERVAKEGTAYKAFRLLPANGIIDTCKGAVDICIGLIGIMALFMGFHDYCRKSRRYSIFIQDHRSVFFKNFPDIPKGILQWDI